MILDTLSLIRFFSSHALSSCSLNSRSSSAIFQHASREIPLIHDVLRGLGDSVVMAIVADPNTTKWRRHCVHGLSVVPSFDSKSGLQATRVGRNGSC